MSDLYDISVDKIDGTATNLGEHAGEVLLVVNVASKCGLTPQYEGLEALHEQYRDQKFSVLGFPANDFAGQEPGSNEEIQEFCSSTYGVDFPLYSKIPVTGPDKHPLYAHLTAAEPNAENRESMEEMLRGYDMEPTAPGGTVELREVPHRPQWQRGRSLRARYGTRCSQSGGGDRSRNRQVSQRARWPAPCRQPPCRPFQE